MNGKRADRLQSELNISIMFLKAAEEVKEKRAESEERMKRTAAEAARRRREEAEGRAVYAEYRRINGYTEQERETARREFLETLNECTGIKIK